VAVQSYRPSRPVHPKLDVLGLGPDAETVYAVMVGQPRCRVSDLVIRTGMAEARVRAALDELADLTFVRPSGESPDGLRVVGPQVAMDVLVRRQEADLARRIEQLAASKAVAAEVVAALGDTVVDILERLDGVDAVEARLEALAAATEQECLSVLSGGAQSARSMELSRPVDEDSLRRGIRMRTLYQDSLRNDAPTFAYARWLVDNGGEVRTAPLLPPRMVIFDRRTAVVPTDGDTQAVGALCTWERGIVATLVATFEMSWTTAAPLAAGRERGTADGDLTDYERELLSLLAQGITDQAAARRLGIGLRTVRRQMSGLMDRLGAASRFEAGLKAAQRGWL
jgi:DNA-binding CsgD family transcriptional regulator/sugar-specific transcriptional regulator TrmB